MPKYLSIARKYTGTLRTYQRKGVAEVRESLANGPTLLVSPTGAGKTDMAAVIAEDYRNVLFVAHRRELLAQAEDPMGSHVVRMSIQSALRYGPEKVQLLIIDEAHRSKAKTYQMLIEKYSTAARLGLTATPLRTDGQGLCDAFSHMVQISSVKELVESGHLVPYIPYGPSVEALEHLDKLKQMKKVGGDYDPKALAELVNTPRLIGQVVSEYQEKARDRRAIVFAVSVAHSKALEAEFKRRNIRAVHIDGRASLKVRDSALQQVASGEVEVLCNVNLFTEGWDCPAVSSIVMARPTASLTLYLQCVGRGMRPDEASGKENLVILDHAGNMDRHGMPDEDRKWSLEGRVQRERRERETAELERIYALGFASLEQYRLEKRKYDSGEWITLSAVAKLCGATIPRAQKFFTNHNLTGRKVRFGGLRVYPKAEAVRLASTFPKGLTIEKVAERCAITVRVAERLVREESIQVDAPLRMRRMYPADQVDRLAAKLRDERQHFYDIHAIAKIFAKDAHSVRQWLRGLGLGHLVVFSDKCLDGGARIPKQPIDDLAKVLIAAGVKNVSAPVAADAEAR